MVLFHAVRDLEFFGILAPATTQHGGWAIFARLTAGSFLFLAGLSLVLAHGQRIRWRSLFRRSAVIALAALAVSLATYLAMPRVFVFFGILHMIVVGRLLGIAFLRLPIAVILAAAALIWVLPSQIHAPLFDPRWLAWIGFAAHAPPALDFEPVFPWLAPCLLGIAVGRLLPSRLPDPRKVEGGIGTVLAWAGRHSLPIYLVHQPLMLGLMWLIF